MEKINDTNIIMSVMHLSQASSLLKNYEAELSKKLLELAYLILNTYHISANDFTDTANLLSSYINVDETEPIS